MECADEGETGCWHGFPIEEGEFSPDCKRVDENKAVGDSSPVVGSGIRAGKVWCPPITALPELQRQRQEDQDLQVILQPPLLLQFECEISSTGSCVCTVGP